MFASALTKIKNKIRKRKIKKLIELALLIYLNSHPEGRTKEQLKDFFKDMDTNYLMKYLKENGYSIDEKFLK